MVSHTTRPFYARRAFQLIASGIVLATSTLLISCASHEPAAGFEPEWEKLVVEVAQFPKAQPTGVAVSSTGRVFVNFPYWDKRPGVSVAELDADGVLQPFPSRSWNRWDGSSATSALRSFVSAQALYVDKDDYLWALDSGSPRQESGVVIAGPKLFKIDLSDNSIAQVFYFDQKRDLTSSSFLSDFRVDSEKNVAYITDAGRGGIIVYNLKTRDARTVLLGHESTQPQEGLVATIGSHPWVNFIGQRPSYGVAGIELSKDNKWLYYHPLCGRELYRVPTAALNDETLTAGRLGAAVEDLGSTGSIVDGMWLDDNDNLYLTAIEKDAIYVRRPSGEIETFVADERLQWPDSLAMGNDGYLYFTTSMRHLQSPYRVANVKTQPYYLMKVSVAKVQRAVEAKQDAEYAREAAAQASLEAAKARQAALQQKRQAELVKAAAEREAQRVAHAQQLALAAAQVQLDAAQTAEQAALQQAQIAAQAQAEVELAKAQLAEAQAAVKLAKEAAAKAKALAEEAQAKAQAGEQAKAQALAVREQAQAAKAAYEQALAQSKAAQAYAQKLSEQLAQQQTQAQDAQQQALNAAAQAKQQASAAENAKAQAQFAKQVAEQAQQQAWAAENAESGAHSQSTQTVVEVETDSE
ncbi:MAG: L-dopachrome tautomerase-related protein [Phycisphaerales bacterium]